MTGIIRNMAGMVGNMRFMKLLNTAVKQHFQVSRPFFTVVIEQDGNASIHSNMDNAAQRIDLLEQCVKSLKGIQN